MNRRERRNARKVSRRTKLVAGAIAAVGLTGGAVMTAPAFGGAGGVPGPTPKVTICHHGVDELTGEPTLETISVGAPAVDAHLAHGDTLGECAVA